MSFRLAATGSMALVAVTLVTGCGSQVPFYRSGAGGPGGPVVGLGGPAPYVTLAPPEVAAEPPVREASLRGAERVPDVYAATRAGMSTPRFPARVYVPDGASGTVVIDQRTFRVIGRLRTGRRPRSVVPAWDLRTLWVNDVSGSLVPLDPRTGRRGTPVKLTTPGNLYFTPDGRTALVMAGKYGRIDLRDPRTMAPRGTLRLPCRGAAHADFSADETFFVAGCESSGQLVRVDPALRKVTGLIRLGGGSRPADIRLSPDGAVFHVADRRRGGVWVVDAARFRKIGFIPTGSGAHGLYPSRDATLMYVTNSGDASVSVIDFAKRRVLKRWRLPRGAAPETAGLSADGTVLWLSGRGTVYALSTRTGRLLHRIKVGKRSYGLCVYPQPARYSLGHAGHFR